MNTKTEKETPIISNKNWSTTFTDLLLLLLTFFALKLSLSTLKPFEALDSTDLSSTRKAPSILKEVSSIKPNLLKRFNKSFKADKQNLNIETISTSTNNLFHISLTDNCYAEGLPELNFKTEVLVKTLSKLAKENPIAIEIYTSPNSSEITNLSPLSTWELSRERSISILRQMFDAGVDTSAVSIGTREHQTNIINSKYPLLSPARGCLNITVKPKKKMRKPILPPAV